MDPPGRASLCYAAFVAIVGERPESGVRIAIERPREGGPPWSYGGSVFLPAADFRVEVAVSDGGEVDVTIAPSAPVDLAEKIRLIVRAAYRQAKSDGEPPAFRIVRWRADR